jgi:hypothetical protein
MEAAASNVDYDLLSKMKSYDWVALTGPTDVGNSENLHLFHIQQGCEVKDERSEEGAKLFFKDESGCVLILYIFQHEGTTFMSWGDEKAVELEIKEGVLNV